MPTDTFEQFFRRPSRRSFQALVRAEQSTVLSTAWRVLGDRGLAEDVAQEIFMSVLQHTQGEERGEDRARWLNRTIGLARTRLRTERRRQGREQKAAEERAGKLDTSAEDRAALVEVRDAVSRLPEDWRQCTELRYFAGLSSQEIAGELNLSRRAVDERLGKARGKLEAELSVLGAATFASPPQALPTGLATSKLMSLAGSLPAMTATAKSVLWLGAILSIFSTYWIVTTLTSLRSEEVPIVDSTASLVGDSSTREALAGTPRIAEKENVLMSPGATPSSRREVEIKAPQANVSPADQPGQSRTLRVRVVDSENRPLSGATLLFEADGLATMSSLLSLEAAFQPFESLLEPIQLDAATEWSVSNLPDEIRGLEFVLNAYAEGRGTAEPVRFTISEAAETELTVACPEFRRVRIACTSAATGEALPDAVITKTTEARRRDLDPEEACVRADANGWVELESLGAGEQQLLVQARGYVPLAATLSAEGATEVELRLTPMEDSATLRVRAIGPLGEPLDETPVTVLHQSTKAKYQSATDSRGEVVFDDLPPHADYMVELDLRAVTTIFRGVPRTEDRWTALMAFVKLEPGQERVLTLGELQGEARRAFQFVDALGNALAHQELYLSGPVGRTLETDDNGWVVLNKIPAGSWQIDYGFGRTHEFEVPEGNDTNSEERVVLGDASIAGIVRGPKGEPFPGALILLVGRQTDMTRSDEEGRFLVEHLPRGESYEVHAHHADHEDQKVSTATDSQGEQVTVELRFEDRGVTSEH